MRQHQERAVILVIVLLGIVLIAGVMAVVINTGYQLNRGQHLQDAADATAMGAATTGARMMNTVAMNNVDMSLKIAGINSLDSAPMATSFTRQEQEWMHESLDNQLSTTPLITINSTLDALAQSEFSELLQELEEELDLLVPVDELFQSYDIREDTHFQAPSGRMGNIWQALYAMSAMSQANMEYIGPMIQYEAAISAKQNLPTVSSDAIGFVLPLNPEIPFQRGSFSDFERPVRQGLLPSAIDDPQARRGPYDAVFGWRNLLTERFGAEWVPGTRQVASGGRGNTPISGGAGGGGGGGRWVGGTTEVIGYRTYGTQEWINRLTGHWVGNHMENSRLNSWMRNLSNTKNRYLWDNIEIQQVREPDWVINFNEATSIGDSGTPEIAETAFFILEYKSKYPVGHPDFLSPGTYAKEYRNSDQNPRITIRSGWLDPRSWGVPQQGNYSWLDQWTYTVFFDESIGITQELDAEDNPIAQPVYRIDVFLFAGVNIGEMVDITNPYVGFNKDSSDAPAPMNLNHGLMTGDEVSNMRYLNFLGTTRRGDGSPMMTSAFRGGKPYPYMVRVAQSRIVNNHSFDLWTPMWHAQLAPVSNFDDFVTNASNEEMPGTPQLNENNLQDQVDYLRKVSPMSQHIKH